ncbi:MAG: 16S rRNA (cytosine(1402)-N(4))-methyltransferase RsmH [Patescibacteria group bacterium]
MPHIPVLLKEVIQYLDPKPGDKIIDATFSGGGHSLAILEKTVPEGKVLGIEWDEELFKKAEEKFSSLKNLVLANGNFRDLKKIAEENGFDKADGILIDLGMSSWHLEESKRGFSFRRDEPLDMRYSESESLTAREIVNQWPPEAIQKILEDYGEEKFARQISKAIVEQRKKKSIISTFQLVEAIKSAVPIWYKSGRRIHFATKTFQALRIAVNDELNNIVSVLDAMNQVLAAGGRGVVISFHSLEDRIVKNKFKDFEKAGIGRILTKKPVQPAFQEIKLNPRCRSAKMRVIEKVQ